MVPKLVFISGPLKGTIFEISEAVTTVGRDPNNKLSIIDKALSRQHCFIKREDGQFKIQDLDSHNGTFVNEVPCKEQSLNNGDRIQAGNSFFLFLLDEGRYFEPPAAQIDNGTLVTASSINVKLEDALFSIASEINVLVKISAALTSLRSLQSMQRKLIESIFEVVPAQRGAIILFDGDLDNHTSVFSLNRFPTTPPLAQVSRTVAQQVLQEKVAILSNDLVENTALSKSESLMVSKISVLLCVPLMLRDRPVGFIYLDSTDPATNFTKGHLQLVAAISSFAAGTLENVRHLEWMESENQRLQAAIQNEHNLVGDSTRMREVYQFILRVAPNDSTVMIRGESGTGKELVARAIHQNSQRAGKPFVAINCAALVESLLESELFGHEKGAFTGAIAQKKGKLEAANGGTVFLDEIGEMSPSIQAKLLRVLEEREVERLGETQATKIDIRVISATNKNLEEAIGNSSFRQDLYYRLNVLSLTMPPLRDRPADIPLLAHYFIAKYSNKCKRRVMGLSPEARQCLMSYAWPGNVRELENAIERGVVLGTTDRIQPEDLPETLLERVSPATLAKMRYYELVKEAKKQIVLNAFIQTGSYSEAAKLLGLHTNNLHRLIRSLDIKSSLSKDVMPNQNVSE